MNKELKNIALVCAAVLAQGVQADLITNGSFENPALAGEFSVAAVGAGSLTGWTVSTDDVVIINGFDNFDAWTQPAVASAGNQFLQLESHTASTGGTVSQSFTTVVGQAYELTFDYSGIWPGANNTLFTYDVGEGTQTVNVSIAANQAPWQGVTDPFVAASTTTTLSFTGTHIAGFWGSSIDNVSVTAIPEPAGFGLLVLGGLIASALRRRVS